MSDREYGIVYARWPDEPHRTGMTKAQAEEWIASWVEDGGKPDMFKMIWRDVGEWQHA